jgi:hypothetical protein
MFIFLQWLVQGEFTLTQKHVAGTVTEEDFLLINFCLCRKTYSWFCCFCALSFTFKIILLCSYINCTRHRCVITYVFILIKVIFKIHKIIILTKFIVSIIKFQYGCWVNFVVYSLTKKHLVPFETYSEKCYNNWPLWTDCRCPGLEGRTIAYSP